jgi:hypothetical protein
MHSTQNKLSHVVTAVIYNCKFMALAVEMIKKLLILKKCFNWKKVILNLWRHTRQEKTKVILKKVGWKRKNTYFHLYEPCYIMLPWRHDTLHNDTEYDIQHNNK